MNFHKGTHEDWSKYSPEMEEYCTQDVRVTYKLFNVLLRNTEWLPWEALDIEQQVQAIITQQYQNGWLFDVKAAQKLHIELVGDLEVAEKELFEVFKPMYLPQGKPKTPSKPFKRMGVETIGEHQPIKLLPFNPGSGHHIVWWVDHLYGKQEWRMTDKGTPKTDADTLIEMFSDYSWATPLLHYMEVQKILGQLAEGPKAWLKLVSDDNRLRGGVDILGTNTGRATHSNPNLAQVPSVDAYKGKESRALFISAPGMVNVGCDLSGVELRCLAHYMALYDKGEYANVILEGDIHTTNQEAAGLPTRNNAKTFIYGFLYGAGDAKIGKIVGGTAKDGKRLKTQFLKGLPALSTLLKKIKEKAKQGYLTGITGRRLHIRSPHSAPNVLLQSLGAYISKYWMIEAHKMLNSEGLFFRQLGWIHDEIQIECYEKDAARVGEILQDAARIASEKINIRMRIDAESKIGKSWYEVH
ncbi:MAG: hypothetical protein JHC33_07745 [Ignisphaera sp.]|nr:hypothetical protein [Ignisphaera sp.]